MAFFTVNVILFARGEVSFRHLHRVGCATDSGDHAGTGQGGIRGIHQIHAFTDVHILGSSGFIGVGRAGGQGEAYIPFHVHDTAVGVRCGIRIIPCLGKHPGNGARLAGIHLFGCQLQQRISLADLLPGGHIHTFNGSPGRCIGNGFLSRLHRTAEGNGFSMSCRQDH